MPKEKKINIKETKDDIRIFYNNSLITKMLTNIFKELILPSTKILGNKKIGTNIDYIISILCVVIIFYLHKHKDDVDKTYKTLLKRVIPLFGFYMCYNSFMNNMDLFKLSSEKRNKNELYNYINLSIMSSTTYFLITLIDEHIDDIVEKKSESLKKLDKIIAPNKIKSIFSSTLSLVNSTIYTFLVSYYISAIAIYFAMRFLLNENEDISFSEVNFKAFIRTLLNEKVFASIAAIDNIETTERKSTLKIQNKLELEKQIDTKEVIKKIKQSASKTNTTAQIPKDDKPTITKYIKKELASTESNSNEKLEMFYTEGNIYFSPLANKYLVNIFEECVLDVSIAVYRKLGRNYVKEILSRIELFVRKGNTCGIINGYSNRNSISIIVSFNELSCKDSIDNLKKEIRAVIAHEFSHSFLTHRYYFRNVITVLSSSNWYRLVPSSSIWISVLSDYVSFIYERQNELEADAFAAEILENDDVLFFLTKIQKTEGNHDFSILRAHGTIEQRILSAKYTYEQILAKKIQDNQTKS